MQPYQRALAEYYLGLAQLKLRRNVLGTFGITSRTRGRLDDALRVFQSTKDAIKADAAIKDIDVDIANAQKVLTGELDKSMEAGDIDWVVIR